MPRSCRSACTYKCYTKLCCDRCLICESNVLSSELFLLLLSFHNIVTSEDAGRVWSCVENAINLMAEEAENSDDVEEAATDE